MNNIIGICALAGSGKDTVAEFLQPYRIQTISLADEIKRICMSVYQFSEDQLWGPSEFRNKPDERYLREQHTLVKQQDEGYACACCGFEDTWQLLQVHNVPCYLTPRYALQKIGTEWGRDCYDPTWVELLFRNANQLLDGDGHMHYHRTRGVYHHQGSFWLTRSVIVPDVRFENEVAGIRTRSGKVVRLVRPHAGLKGAQAQHKSETEQQGIPDGAFDLVISNDGSLEDLKDKVEAMATQFGLTK